MTHLGSHARKWSAAAALTFFVGASLAEEAHLALVQHVRCAAHGEVAHARATAEQPPHVVAQAHQDRAVEALELEGGHQHEHCLGMAARLATLPAAHAQAAGGAAVKPCAPGEARTGTTGLPLLRLAPKASPPA